MNNKEDDKSSHFSSAKTSASLTNEDSDIFPITRQRAGIKSKINNFQSGRHTVAVPLNSFSGISHNASFQSKLLFFNGGKQKPKYQMAHDKAITEENDKKENKIKKSLINKEDKNQKVKEEKVDLDSNININKILEQKNNNNNKNINKIDNNNIDNDYKKYKKKSVFIPSSHLHSLILDPEKSNSNKKVDSKKESPLNIKLKSLKYQWYYQKILLDYNILDFTSKYIIYNINSILI